MKNSLISLVIGSFLLLACGEADVNAQAETEDAPFWYVSKYKIPWAKVDSLQKLVTKYTMPVVKEAVNSGTLMDYKLLVHHTGSEYNVVIMQQYPSWEDLNQEDLFSRAMEKVIPDEMEREKVNEAFNWVFEGSEHRDNIYRDITYNK